MAALMKEDTHALRTLVERWERRLLQFTYRYVQIESSARDLTQETFVRIYQNRDKFNPERRFSTWMFGIAANLCRNHQRWLKRHAETAFDDVVEPVEEETPADKIHEKEQVRAVRTAIAELPHALRVTLLLYYYEGQSYAEIAEVLDCSVRGIESRLYRARRLLGKSLGLKSGHPGQESVHGHSRIGNTAPYVLYR